MSQRHLDEVFMRGAIAVAKDSAGNRDYPFGALMVMPDGNILKGMNTARSAENPLAHCEMNAISEACRVHGNRHLPKGCTLYTTHAPCIMCLGGCIWSKVSRIVYGCMQKDIADHSAKHNLRHLGIEPDELYDKYLKSAHPGMEIVGGVLRDECLSLFEYDCTINKIKNK